MLGYISLTQLTIPEFEIELSVKLGDRRQEKIVRIDLKPHISFNTTGKLSLFCYT